MGQSAQAVPVQWTVGAGGNDHWYEVITTTAPISWSNARTAALASTHLGQSGYLATITSLAENRFVQSLSGLVNTLNTAWLGGSDQTVEGTWRWADGPEAGQVFWNGGAGGSTPSFARWALLQPDNLFNEDFLQMIPAGFWNDITNNPGLFAVRRYVVEYNPVPEPASLALFGGALIGLRRLSRR